MRLGPAELRGLWKKVEAAFTPASGETIARRETWVEGRARTYRHEFLHVDTMDEFLDDVLPGLLDDVEVGFEAEVRRPGATEAVSRSIRVRLWAYSQPEVTLTGDREWSAAREKEIEGFLQENSSDSRRKRFALAGIFFLGAFLYIAKNSTSPQGEGVALFISGILAGFVGGFAYLFSDRRFPLCRVFSDPREENDPWWYRYGVYVAGTVLLGIVGYLLTPYL